MTTENAQKSSRWLHLCHPLLTWALADWLGWIGMSKEDFTGGPLSDMDDNDKIAMLNKILGLGLPDGGC